MSGLLSGGNFFFNKFQNSKLKDSSYFIFGIIFSFNVLTRLFIQILGFWTSPHDINKINFINYSKVIGNSFLIMYLSTLVLYKATNQRFYYFFAIINNLMMDLALIFIMGIIRSYFTYQSDLLFLLLIFEMFLRIILSITVYQNFRLIRDYSILVILFNILLMCSVHSKLSLSVINFIFSKLILLIFLNLFAYIMEKSRENEFKNLNDLKKEKDFYFDILDSMNIGIFFMRNSNIYFNKVVEDIFDEFPRNSDLHNIIENETNKSKSF